MNPSNNGTCCKDRYAKRHVEVFFDIKTTKVSQSYRTHWNGLDDSAIRFVEIKLEEFQGAERITCIGKDAHDLFKTATTFTPLSCQTVFSNWENAEFEVTFWMKDSESSSSCSCC